MFWTIIENIKNTINVFNNNKNMKNTLKLFILCIKSTVLHKKINWENYLLFISKIPNYWNHIKKLFPISLLKICSICFQLNHHKCHHPWDCFCLCSPWLQHHWHALLASSLCSFSKKWWLVNKIPEKELSELTSGTDSVLVVTNKAIKSVAVSAFSCIDNGHWFWVFYFMSLHVSTQIKL